MKQSLKWIGLSALLALGAPALSQAANHGHAGHDMKAMKEMQGMGQAAVIATGVIDQVVPSEKLLKVTHDPIPAWNMGAMRMKFHVGEQVNMQGLQAGQKIRFKLENPKVGRYLITEILDR